MTNEILLIYGQDVANLATNLGKDPSFSLDRGRVHSLEPSGNRCAESHVWPANWVVASEPCCILPLRSRATFFEYLRWEGRATRAFCAIVTTPSPYFRRVPGNSACRPRSSSTIGPENPISLAFLRAAAVSVSRPVIRRATTHPAFMTAHVGALGHASEGVLWTMGRGSIPSLSWSLQTLVFQIRQKIISIKIPIFLAPFFSGSLSTPVRIPFPFCRATVLKSIS